MSQPDYKEQFPNITIVGNGKVATFLVSVFSRLNLPVKCIIAKNKHAAEQLATEFGIDNFLALSDDFEIHGLVFIAVSDQAIESVSNELAGKASGKTVYFVHCSGALNLSVLSTQNDKITGRGCFHPLQTIQAGSSKETLKNAGISILTDNPELENLLFNLAELLGAKPFRISPHQKKLLHIAAVFASNYLNTLLHQLHQLEPELKLMEPGLLNILEPLILQTVQGVVQKGTVESLTGPISRGDIKTITEHMKALEVTNKQLLKVYSKMGELTAKQAFEAKLIDTETYQKFIELFSNGI